jgi:site-specific recombinase XerD
MNNDDAITKMKKCMELRGLAPSTQENYVMHVKLFAKFFNMSYEDMNLEHVRDYLYDAIKNRKLSGDYTNCIYASIKFLYEGVLERDWKSKTIPRRKKMHKLPQILSMEETKKLIFSLENIKHKAILLTIYSAGLRLSEVTNLKINDINSESMKIFIRQGKGNKDRYTLLAQSTLKILREYYKKYRPKEWLFPGRNPLENISNSTVQAIFRQAKEKSGIKKNVTVHSLRHGFATHLIEAGVDVLRIKDLMGHNQISTTCQYIHLAQKDILKVISPADMLGGRSND